MKDSPLFVNGTYDGFTQQIFGYACSFDEYFRIEEGQRAIAISYGIDHFDVLSEGERLLYEPTDCFTILLCSCILCICSEYLSKVQFLKV